MAESATFRRTILVTGGAGFIGSAFVRRAVRQLSWRVINLDLLTYAGSLQSLEAVANDPRHVFVKGDIADEDLVGQLLRDYGPSTVVHFAAQTHVDRSIDGPRVFVETNVLGTERLLATALRYWRHLPAKQADAFRLVNVSTDEVYGSLGPEGACTESSPYAPNSPYAASKAAADHLARSYFHTYGLPTITTHSSNNYGPFQFPEKLIPLCLMKALRGETIPVYGDGQHVRDWLYVEDHCRAIELIVERGTPGETYNIGAGHGVSNLALVKIVLGLLEDVRPPADGSSHVDQIRFVEDRPGHDRRYALDCSKIGSQLGWKPRESLSAGLRKTVAWYVENVGWVESIAAEKYSGERLGAARAC